MTSSGARRSGQRPGSKLTAADAAGFTGGNTEVALTGATARLAVACWWLIALPLGRQRDAARQPGGLTGVILDNQAAVPGIQHERAIEEICAVAQHNGVRRRRLSREAECRMD